MSKDKKNKPANPKQVEFFFMNKPFLWLILLCIAVYGRSLWLGYAELDDSIFIKEMSAFNSDWGNIIQSFHRGVFNPVTDIYYRPVFLIDFIIEGHLFGTNITFYHFTNLLFHIISVLLLFVLFRKLKTDNISAFMLTALFAVHPVLTQAVAWIPGRNDMLLCIFLLSALIALINYVESGKWQHLLLFGIMLLVSLFTKETALAFPVVCLAYLLLVAGLKPADRKVISFFLPVIAAFVIYWVVKSTATLGPGTLSKNVLGLIIYRVPLIIQYIGKALLPVNLSVYPIMEDTSNVYGIIATVFLIIVFVATKSYTNRLSVLGLLWFGIFLSPLLLVPKEMNNQIFEHRLYLPLMGLLLFAGQVIKWGNSNMQQVKLYATAGLILVFSIVSFSRQSYFSDPVTFWSKAVDDSPHSPSAKTFLAMRIFDLPGQKQKAIDLFHQAYNENPDERWLNYYLAAYYQTVDSLDKAEFHARKEIQITNYFEANFLMAGLMFKKNEKDSALVYLERVATLNPKDERIYNNMTMLYLEKNNVTAARQTIQRAEANGVTLNPDLIKSVNLREKGM